MKYHAFLPAFLALASAQFAHADVVYLTQSRTLDTTAYNAAPQHSESIATGVFESSLVSESFVGQSRISAGRARVYSSLTARSIDYTLSLSGDDSYSNGGVGGGGGTGVLDVTFSVVAPQRYDFVAILNFDSNSPWYSHTVSGSLTGSSGAVFALQTALVGTQRFSGILAAGDYHLRISRDLLVGGFATGQAGANLSVNLTVPAPASLSTLAVGLLAARRRR